MRRIFSLSTSLRCSLRCDYCASGFNHPAMQKRKALLDDMGARRYLALVEQLPIPENALINFHGPAEPLEDENFADLFAGLYRGERTVRVYTNLLKPAPLVELVSGYECQGRAGGVEVAASYHVASYRGGQRKTVMEALTQLVGTRAFVRLMVPATPAALTDPCLEDDLVFLERHSVGRFEVSVIPLGHELHARPYPASYTEEELWCLSAIGNRWGLWQRLPSKLPLLRELGGPLRLQGQPCWYPMIHAAVGIDGRVWNCGPEHEPERRLGGPVVSLYADGPVPCPHPVCTCKPRGVEYSLEARGISHWDYLGLTPRLDWVTEGKVR